MKIDNVIKTIRLFVLPCMFTMLALHGSAQHLASPKTAKQMDGKHEIGFSWGAFPTSGIFSNAVAFWRPGYAETGPRVPILSTRYSWFSHHEHSSWDGPHLINEETGEAYRGKEEHYNSQHYGCLTFNYQYHFTKKHSIGFTASWLGRYVSNYTAKPQTNEIISAKGWDNIFTLCFNYRFTYYSKDAVSLYTGIHLGFGMGFISRKLLFDSEDSFYIIPGLQITGFGIEAGKTHAFITELGFGAQGLLKVGYRYKFNGKEKNRNH